MLKILRKKKIMKRLLWALAILIIPAFVLWGAGSLSKKEAPFKYVGTIDGKKVTLEDFIKSAKDVQVGLFLNYFNQPQVLDKVLKDRPLMNRLAWESLLIKNSAQKDGVTVSNKEVVGFVTGHPIFTRGGAFDKELYNYILRNSLALTPRDFEESVRSFLVNVKYRSRIVSAVDVTDAEALNAYKKEVEKVALNYILVDKKDFSDRVEIKDEEITSLYEQNKENFREPEKVVLEYIAFPHKEAGEKDKALSDLEAAYKQLSKRPRDMESVSKELNLSLEETKPFARNELVPGIGNVGDMGNISFGLKPLSDIVPVADENESGISYIIRVKEKIPSRIKTKDEVSSYIVNTLNDKKSSELAGEKARKIYEKIKNDSLELKDVSAAYGLKLYTSDFVSRYDYIDELGEAYKVVETAFSLKAGEISRPVEVRKGYAIIEPLGFKLMDEAAFEKAKPEYKTKILTVKKMKALEDWLGKSNADSGLLVDLDRI